jgi:type I restriction enzyme S subunit
MVKISDLIYVMPMYNGSKFDLSEVFEMDFDKKDREIFALRSGDILICEGGEPGRASIWNCEVPECYFQKALHRVRIINNQADPTYIVFFYGFFQKTAD